MQHRQRTRRIVAHDRDGVLRAGQEGFDERGLSVLRRHPFDLGHERFPCLDPRASTDALRGSLPAWFHEERERGGKLARARLLGVANHETRRNRHSQRSRALAGPALVERERERQGVGAEHRNPRHFEQHRSPRLAISRAISLRDVEHRIDRREFARADCVEQLVGGSNAMRYMAQVAQRLLENAQRAFGFVFDRVVGWVVGLPRIGVERLEDEPNAQRSGVRR